MSGSACKRWTFGLRSSVNVCLFTLLFMTWFQSGVPEMGVSQIFVACDPWADDGKCRQALDVIIAKLCQNMLPEYEINDTM